MKDPTTSPDALDDLMIRSFHGLASAADSAALTSLLKASSEARARYAAHAQLHGLLASEAKAGTFAADREAFFADMEKTPAHAIIMRTRRWWWLSAAAAMIVGLFSLTLLLAPNNASALNQVIAALDRSVDCSYVIKVIDHGSDHPAPPIDQPDRGRFPPAAFLDGARLYLRGTNQYLLEQYLPDHVIRLLGSNGQSSWSIRGDGPVRTSTDPYHFGAGVLAGKQKTPFLELRTQLEDLRQFYQLEQLKPVTDPTTSIQLAGLRGSRHTTAQGGPKEIELWFDARSGQIHRIQLSGLPREAGGPASIMLELTSTAPLPADFFQHQSHHDGSRPVESEEKHPTR